MGLIFPNIIPIIIFHPQELSRRSKGLKNPKLRLLGIIMKLK